MPRTITEDDTGLHVLVDNSDDHEDAVDIVAIHGRGAHPADTWCQLRDAGADKSDPESYIDWLRDDNMLPNVVAHARILRYGYESAWFGENNINTAPRIVSQRLLEQLLAERKECPRRPLIFISHCFGGLVVLQVLHDSHIERSRWQDIYDSTVGLIFFGTPFRGSEKLSQEKVVQLAQQKYGQDKVLESALRFSRAGEESLASLVDQYLRIARQGPRPKVACFYEQKSTNFAAVVDKEASFDTVWVTESSGTLDVSESVEKYSRACDHFAINKFYSPRQEDFKTLVRVVQGMVQEGPKILAQRLA
ncbi:uncharacterized protein K489DRAFT_351602, partial [Dissoconium aciculare CBS 342.82]|uniref:DUF676 domain-containing protein n=1 Tax=Dissoconium aciculare CBS 342.82 TaxID=1314786 RepID=A0A6J3MG11_9PEZI